RCERFAIASKPPPAPRQLPPASLSNAGSAALRGNIPHAGDECRKVCPIPFQMDPRGRSWPRANTDARPPFSRRPDRPGREPAAAIRADVVQHRFDALGAEGAFETADTRVRRIWWQVLVAVLTVRSQLQHQRILKRRAERSTATSRRLPASRYH